MAARQAPQLRIFRNEHRRLAAVRSALRLTGTGKSNRDAIGARVVRRDRPADEDEGRAGRLGLPLAALEGADSSALGPSERIRTLTVGWPRGEDAAVHRRRRLDRHAAPGRRRTSSSDEPVAATPALPPTPRRRRRHRPPPPAPPGSTSRSRRPASPRPTCDGETRSLAALAGKPALLLFWTAARSGRTRGARRARRAAATRSTPRRRRADRDRARPRRGAGARAAGGAGAKAGGAAGHARAPADLALSYAIAAPPPVHEPAAICRCRPRSCSTAGPRREGLPRRRVDAGRHRRATRRRSTPPRPSAARARAARSPGRSTRRCRSRNFLPYGRELLDQGLEAAAVVAFERAAQANPNASTLYRLGTLLAKSGEPARARAAYERALALQPDLAEAQQRSRRAARPRAATSTGAVERFRAALAATPDYPDALNNLGYALLLMGRGRRGAAAVRAGARAAARFPRGAQQHRPAARTRRRPGRGGALLPRGPGEARRPTARRPNNLALVLVARGPDRRGGDPAARGVSGQGARVRGHLRDAGQDSPQRWPDGTKDLRSWSACSSATRRTPSPWNYCANSSRE